jgi:hypothetical protein
MASFIVVRIFAIILGIITGYVLYAYVLKPLVLKPLCLVDSNGCVRMGYYNYNNSALIHMRNTDTWVWYNGDSAFIYGQPIGQLCKDPTKYTGAYEISARTGMKKGYKCVMVLKQVIDFYKEKGVKMKYIVERVKDVSTFSIYDVLNIFSDRNIIDLRTATD